MLCSSAVSEHGGSWQPRSGNLPFWAAALLDGGDGSDLSLAMCKGYKPYSDPSQDVPPPLVSQDPPGCPGAGPRAVPAPALPWLRFARAPPGLQTGHGPLAPRAQGAGSMAPAPAGLLHPALAPVAARLLVFTGQGRGDRSPRTALTCPAAPPVRMCVLQQQASEAAARVGCPQPWLFSWRRVRVPWGFGVSRAQRQQHRDVPGVLGSHGTAASLPSHLENLIHANYAEKSLSDNDYEIEA